MNIAVLGLGFMGATHAQAWNSVAGANLAAVMSSDERKLSGDLSSIEGNLGNSIEPLDFSALRKYRTVEDTLADRGIDAVDICLPTDLHAPVAIAALRAGKHVMVEKPLALSYSDAAAVITEAERGRLVLMAGHVLRFIPAYVEFRQRVSSPVHSAFFRRRCAAPGWSRWVGDPERSGGGVFDLLIHDADYCISLWGMPDSVQATGYEDLAAGIDIIHAVLSYPALGPVVITGGWHHPKAYPFSMEFTIVTGDGTFEWQSGAPALRQYTPAGEQVDHPLEQIDPFAAELACFAQSVRENRTPAFCPPAQSAQAVALMRFMLESRSRNGERIVCRM
jgi:predicted dehydrogenase